MGVTKECERMISTIVGYAKEGESCRRVVMQLPSLSIFVSCREADGTGLCARTLESLLLCELAD
jgi:hypothetical protein